MNLLRYWRHVLVCWRYQLQQSSAMRDIAFHRMRVRECTDALTRAKTAEISERMAFEQYRRVMRKVAQ